MILNVENEGSANIQESDKENDGKKGHNEHLGPSLARSGASLMYNLKKFKTNQAKKAKKNKNVSKRKSARRSQKEGIRPKKNHTFNTQSYRNTNLIVKLKILKKM